MVSKGCLLSISVVTLLLAPLSEAFSPVGHASVPISKRAARQPSELFLFRRLFRRGSSSDEKKKTKADSDSIEEAAVCIVGGGVSGLTAAITAANALKKKGKVILLEKSQDGFGGRVFTDKTDDGYLLDRGFAVFIEEYPNAKKLLDYDDLKLGKFLPGALVKLKGRTNLAKVCDPLRQPETLIDAILAPVGSLFDKINLIPLILTARTKSVEELFEEAETDTLTALQDRWAISDNLLDRFFKPFLEGIYLAPLEQQSSRMFSFVFKMFSEGAATLPAGGIGAVAKQLASKAQAAGADLRLGKAVTTIAKEDDGFMITIEGDYPKIKAKSIVVATDGVVAQKLLSQIEGFESLENLPAQPQRAVGNLYYSFKGDAPVQDPILILSGYCDERGSKSNPVNNICFPSVVSPSYAPSGYSLCSVTVLEKAMKLFENNEEGLDEAVRKELGQWFPDIKNEIMNDWQLKRVYMIPKAQPGQLKGPMPANINGGRPCNTYRGKELPQGVFVCGDHVATATLDGALNSGVTAGAEAAKIK